MYETENRSRREKLPVGHVTVERPFQRVSVDLVEYKTLSATPDGVRCKYVLSIIDHLTRFALLVALPNKASETVAHVLIERVIGIFGEPEQLHSDRGMEFENEIIHQLQLILGYHKTKTTPHRPAGNAVSERLHSTLHAMLATHVDIKQQDWASFLLFVQLAYNTAYSSTVQETPFFLMFGREARLPVDIIIGLPQAQQSIESHDYSRKTQANLQVAYEIVHRNLREKAANKQTVNKTRTTFPVFKSGQQVLLYRPHTSADGPNPKLHCPWRGPYVVQSQISPVV